MSSNKVAVVSGAAQGIGQAYATRLAQDGIDVAIADLNPAEETERILTDLGVQVKSKICDVRSEDDANAFANFVDSEFGRCDILVNNAGIYPYESFDDMTFEHWRDVMATDLDGPFLMCKAFVPMMREKKWGRIVNIASSENWLVNADNLHYIAAKMGVIGLTRALATEVAEDNITVNAIAPGITNTPTTRRDAPDYLVSLPKMQAIKRVAQPEDMANIMAFLVSDDAKFFTAQVMVNDGGWVRL